MGRAQDVLAFLQANLNRYEEPPHSNRVPGITDRVGWWAALPDSKRQWCDMFLSAGFAAAGMDMDFASCWASRRAYEDGTIGTWLGKPDIADVQPGDQAVCGGGGAEHTFMVAAVDVWNRKVLAYEGNWGDRSLAQWRNYDDPFIYGLGRPHYDGVVAPPIPPTPQDPAPYVPPASGGENPYTPLYVDGVYGPLTVSALQWSLNDSQVADMNGVTPIDVDGVPGVQTASSLQRYLGVAVDGDFGPQSTSALQAHVGVPVDGIWGPQTTKGLQRALNNKTF